MPATCSNDGNASSLESCELTGDAFTPAIVGVIPACLPAGNATSRAACERTGSVYDVGSGARMAASVERITGNVTVGAIYINQSTQLRSFVRMHSTLRISPSDPAVTNGLVLTRLTVAENTTVGGSVGVLGKVDAHSLTIAQNAEFMSDASIEGTLAQTGSLQVENVSGLTTFSADVSTGNVVSVALRRSVKT